MALSLWIQSQWLVSENCGGPPDIIGSFITPTSLSSESFDDSAIPALFAFDYTYGISAGQLPGACGFSLLVPISSRQFCCISSLDTSLTECVSSFSHVGIAFDESSPSLDTLQTFPSASSSTNYCHLIFQESSIGAGSNYYRDYMLKQGANCFNLGTNISLTCDTSALLTIYQDSYCATMSSAFALTEQMQEAFLGSSNFSARLFRIPANGGGLSRGWTSYQPGTLFLLDFRNGFVVAQMCCYIANFLLLLCNAGLILFWTRWDLKSFYYLSSTLFWLLYAILDVILNTAPVFEYRSVALLNFFSSTSLSIAQLLTTITTCFFLHQILAPELLIAKISIYAFPLLSFVLLNLGMYMWAIMNVACSMGIDASCASTEFGTVIYNWWYTNYYWTMFTFVWNIVPINIVAYRTVNNKYKLTFQKTIFELFGKNRKYAALNAANLFVFLIYLLTFCLQSYTTVLDNDKTFWAMDGFQVLMMTSNFIITIIIIDNVKTLLAKKTGKYKEEQALKRIKSQRKKSTISLGQGQSKFSRRMTGSLQTSQKTSA